MSEFKLDTSGSVDSVSRDPEDFYRWSDLLPFTQGYVAALLTDYSQHLTDALREPLHVGFSDLAPETLARIIKDCSWYTGGSWMDKDDKVGADFWKKRQCNQIAGIEPVTVYLGDDGKVRFR